MVDGRAPAEEGAAVVSAGFAAVAAPVLAHAAFE